MSWHPHITVATVIERNGRFLMVKEWAEGEQKFNQPAGHLEPNETLREAALRETLEETAWKIKLTGIVGICTYQSPLNGETYVRTTFIADPLEQVPAQPLDEGIIEALWLTRDEVAERQALLRSPMVLQVIDDYLAGRCYPLEVVDTHM